MYINLKQITEASHSEVKKKAAGKLKIYHRRLKYCTQALPAKEPTANKKFQAFGKNLTKIKRPTDTFQGQYLDSKNAYHLP